MKNDKPTYEELVEREELLKGSQKIAKIGSWDLNLITPKLSWSDQTYHLFDKDLTFEPSFDEFVHLVHPDDSERMHTSFNAALLSDDNPYHVVVRIINDSGREWIMEAFGEVDRDETGTAVRIAGTAQDVSKREWAKELKAKNDELIKAKEEIELNNNRLESLLKISQYQTNSIQ